MSSLSLAAVLAESARRVPDTVALVEGERRLTYAQLWLQARRFAHALRERGLVPGERVALLCPSTVEFVRAYYGILAAGGVVVPVPTLLRNQEIEYLLGDANARFLVAHPSLSHDSDALAVTTRVDVVSPEVAGDAAQRTYIARAPEDIAVLFYTSGTTGHPKGALLTHLNLVMNATVNAFDATPFQRDDVVLGCLPLFHTFGQTVAMNATFRVGATLVLQPRFDAAGAIALMNREHVTTFFGVPTMFQRLTDAARHAAALPALRMCVSGGASLPLTVLESFEQTFGTSVFEGYGLSETAPTAAVNQPAFGSRPGTVGHAIWGVEVEIADADVADRIELLDAGTRGEVVVRGHNVFAGYHDQPEATARSVVDGWFRTGDIGVKDDEGFLSIVDRKKDLIIRNGYNVYPREIEEVLLGHPAVAEVAVVGLPDDRVGEEVCAVLVPTTGRVLDAGDVTEWSRERLGKHKYPRRVDIVDHLPLGPSHKVLKRELRDRLVRTTDAHPALPGSGTASANSATSY